MKKRKVYVNHSKRMIICIVALFPFFLIGLGYSTFGSDLGIFGSINVTHYDSTLYGVVERDYRINGLALKYNGAHQDSMDASKSNKDIYYYNGSTMTKANQIINHFNVLYAGFCWEILRTTDTGGVKMIYNGPAENNQCLETRGTHVGADDDGFFTVNGTYYYGDTYSYHYDSDTSSYVYHLQGNVFQKEWNLDTFESLLGRFTCMSETNGDCTDLYFVSNYYNSKLGAHKFSDNVKTSSIGQTGYNYNRSSISDVGYMFNRSLSMGPTQTIEGSISIPISSVTGMANKTYYYSDSIRYNEIDGVYELYNSDGSDVEQLLFSENYADLSGLYTCNSTSTTCTRGYYILSTTSSSFYHLSFTGGELLNDVDSYIYIGETVDGNQLVNPDAILLSQWNLVDKDMYKDHYVCTNIQSTVCDDFMRIRKYTIASIRGYKRSVVGNYKYATSFTYQDGQYHLSGDVIQTDHFTNSSDYSIEPHYYSCLSESDTCESIYFVIFTKTKDGDDYYYKSRFYYTLSNGESIQDVVNEMLYAPDVNKYDSEIKKFIDGWYQAEMLNLGYTYYLDDVVYCNNRDAMNDISEIGISSGYQVEFTSRPPEVNFMCSRVTDRFSVSNSSAPLKYPISLPTAEELQALGSNSLRNIGVEYRTNTPYFADIYAINHVVGSQGAFNGTVSINVDHGVRQVISIKSGYPILSGDGSRENPYIIANEDL